MCKTCFCASVKIFNMSRYTGLTALNEHFRSFTFIYVLQKAGEQKLAVKAYFRTDGSGLPPADLTIHRISRFLHTGLLSTSKEGF